MNNNHYPIIHTVTEQIKKTFGIEIVDSDLYDIYLKTAQGIENERYNTTYLLHACAFYILRKGSYPFTMKEFSEELSISRRCLFNYMKIVSQRNGIIIPDPISYIERYSHELNIGDKISKLAKKLCKTYNIDTNYSCPNGIAVSCIYVSLIANKCNVSVRDFNIPIATYNVNEKAIEIMKLNNIMNKDEFDLLCIIKRYQTVFISTLEQMTKKGNEYIIKCLESLRNKGYIVKKSDMWSFNEKLSFPFKVNDTTDNDNNTQNK